MSTDTLTIKAPRKTQSIKAMTLSDFLKNHSYKDGVDNERTNTRIPCKNGYGGTYCINDEEYDQFLDIYYQEIIQKNKAEYLTEKQRINDGPIAIDLDLKYDYSVTEKQYNQNHIADLIDLYLEVLKDIYQFDDEVGIEIYIFEKEHVNRVKEKKYTKDGIHMIIGIQSDRTVQVELRKRIIGRIGDVWDLPIINENKWEDVFDKGISEGSVNWQLYGSRKPNHEPYKLTQLYNVKFDSSDGEFMKEKVPLEKFNIERDFKKLSVRYKDHPVLFMNPSFANEYDGLSANRQNRIKNVSSASRLPVRRGELSITNREELDLAINDFLENIPTDDKKELRETYEYTMILPESYYGEGSYTKWVRVGMALRNISNSLLVVWVAFSAKSPSFRFSNVDEICSKWGTFTTGNPDGLTKRSIMYWAKEDAPEEYKRVRESSIDYYLDKTLEAMTVDRLEKQNGRKKPEYASGSGDWDIAEVLYHLHKDEYICAGIKNNDWFKYKNHRWMRHEDANDLRTSISTKLRNLYYNKSVKLLESTVGMDSADERVIKLRAKAQKILDICVRLAKTNDKQNIIKEARTMFYDDERNFLENLDTKAHLLCFNNGVVDFNETDRSKMFRKGYPEDNISLCTHINYVAIDPRIHKPIVDEINEFMHQLFPEKELCDYMWQHLASILIGIQKEESFHMYIGKGRNGKSKLMDLLKLCLGDYKSDIPISLVTEKRTKLGGCAPEIQSLKGIRYAVISEPSKGDRINDGALKQLTGGDVIEGRGLYEKKSTKFKPQFKMGVCTNNLMDIKTQDNGTWRRIRLIHFMSFFTENPVTDDPDSPYQFKVDNDINKKFERWKEIFMSMLVDIAFQTKGQVFVPECVKAASNAYRESQDYIAEFIRDKIIVDKTGRIKKTELNSEFSIWYMSTYGRGGPPPKEVHAYMDKTYGKAKANIGWSGVKIRYERDDIDTMYQDEPDDIRPGDL